MPLFFIYDGPRLRGRERERQTNKLTDLHLYLIFGKGLRSLDS